MSTFNAENVNRMELFVGLIAVGLMVLIFYIAFSAMKDGTSMLVQNLGLKRFFLSTADHEEIDRYLSGFDYYKPLNQEGRKKFRERTIQFMLHREFEGGNGLEVTTEMKILISAAAVQLTFGLSKYKIPSLEKVIILPETFRLHMRGDLYKGAVKGSRMYLSWKDFQEGYAEKDNLNLGLHEMTHALKLNLLLGSRFDQLFANRLGYWEEKVEQIFRESDGKAFSFFRKYAQANSAEFFAVCVEYFFENPADFRSKLPEVYYMLSFLLNQDPLNSGGNYTLDTTQPQYSNYNIPQPKDVKANYKYSNSHWWMYVMIVGVVGAIPTSMFLSYHLIFPWIGYMLLFFTFGTLGLLQRRYFYTNQILGGRYFTLYAYGGFGGAIFTLLLWITYLLPLPEEHTIVHEITGVEVVRGRKQRLEGFKINIPDETQYSNSVLTFRYKPPANAKYLGLKYKYGITGIKRVTGYYYLAGPAQD
jgi:Mlc titration factor MtfA (ptsG expression regulator)